MNTLSIADESSAEKAEVRNRGSAVPPSNLEVGLLTGCKDRPYVFGMATALGAKNVKTDIIGSDDLDDPQLRTMPSVRFLNLRGNQDQKESFIKKLSKLVAYYGRLIRYVSASHPKILHILWNNKFEFFDRTILMLYYKALGKKIAFTAHNVNQGKRDGNDSWLNRVTLNIQYRCCDRIFVHTEKMKGELCREFPVAGENVTVIPFPINNASPDTDLTSQEAKHRLGLSAEEKVILFFGRVRPYKGTEFLLDAFRLLLSDGAARYRLIIAGEPLKGCEEYVQEIRTVVQRDFGSEQILLRMQFIPDADVEMYFKAADVLVLPYKEIFQSGVMFLAYAFGLPVVATDVGSFREEILEGRTGFLCQPGDPTEMAKAIEKYFASDLFANLPDRRQQIKDYANETHSWHAVAGLTCQAYAKMLGRAQ